MTAARIRLIQRNLAEPFPCLVFLTLGEQIPPHLLTQGSQCIQLLVVKLGPPAPPRLGDFSPRTPHDASTSKREACKSAKQAMRRNCDRSLHFHITTPDVFGERRLTFAPVPSGFRRFTRVRRADRAEKILSASDFANRRASIFIHRWLPYRKQAFFPLRTRTPS